LAQYPTIITLDNRSRELYFCPLETSQSSANNCVAFHIFSIISLQQLSGGDRHWIFCRRTLLPKIPTAAVTPSLWSADLTRDSAEVTFISLS